MTRICSSAYKRVFSFPCLILISVLLFSFHFLTASSKWILKCILESSYPYQDLWFFKIESVYWSFMFNSYVWTNVEVSAEFVAASEIICEANNPVVFFTVSSCRYIWTTFGKICSTSWKQNRKCIPLQDSWLQGMVHFWR